MSALPSKQLASGLYEKAVGYRRRFHQNPELSFQEVQTSAFVRETLEGLGIPLREGVSGNSVVAVIDSGKPGPNITYRADMDALPIDEKHDVPYRSQNPGVMHACGHDAHTAILLCLAEAFQLHREELTGKVTCVFQQAEEKIPGGASLLLKDGVLEDVDAIFGLHMSPIGEVGTVSVTVGPRMASVDGLNIKIQSDGGHGSFPQTTGDPITAAASIINQLQLLVTKHSSPLDPLLINICGIRSSSFVANVIPTEVEMTGFVRCFDRALREKMQKAIEELVASLCSLAGCRHEVSISQGYPALINSEKEAMAVIRAAEALGCTVQKGSRSMGSEDFASYLTVKPGCFYFIGCRNAEQGITGKPHTPDFDIDERAMEVGIACMLEVYNSYVPVCREGSGSDA